MHRSIILPLGITTVLQLQDSSIAEWFYVKKKKSRHRASYYNTTTVLQIEDRNVALNFTEWTSR